MKNKRFIGSGNQEFLCKHCGNKVPPLTTGSYRNHCNLCLWSQHVDKAPGDRKETCKGMMEPIGLEHTSKKGYIIIHRCNSCGLIRRNKAALTDPVPDNWDTLISLSGGESLKMT